MIDLIERLRYLSNVTGAMFYKDLHSLAFFF